MDFFMSHSNILLVLMILWSLPWKGFALWKAARLYHKKWFIVLLVLNTLAILDIIYIFFVAKKTEQKTVAKQDIER